MYVDQNIEAQRSTRFCYNEFTQFASRGIYESPLCSEKTEASQLHCTGLIDVCAVIARLQVALLQAPFFFSQFFPFTQKLVAFQMTFHAHRSRLQRLEQIVLFHNLKMLCQGCIVLLTTMLITHKKNDTSCDICFKQWCFVKNNLIIYRVIMLQIFAFMNNCTQVVVWTC